MKIRSQRRTIRDQRGAASIEYAALIALLAAVFAGSAGAAGMGMAKKFSAIAQTLQGPPSSPSLGPTQHPPAPQ